MFISAGDTDRVKAKVIRLYLMVLGEVQQTDNVKKAELIEGVGRSSKRADEADQRVRIGPASTDLIVIARFEANRTGMCMCAVARIQLHGRRTIQPDDMPWSASSSGRKPRKTDCRTTVVLYAARGKSIFSQR